jgi:BirA family biotin operon repressor/biotin-[acetyl-CoA-carboxylase] ligase
LFDTIYYETLPSSNSEAIRLASAGASEGTVVICKEQTAGRGQRDNRWESSPGDNLTASLIMKPVDIPSNRLFFLSKIISLAVVKTLNRYGVKASIKWPNDIYVGTRKIAGILIEHSFYGDRLAFSVTGLGLNVNQVSFPPMNIVPTSIALETGRNYSPSEILSSTLAEFDILYSASKETVSNGYMDNLYRRKGYFPYRTKNDITLIAEIYDVADSGELLLKDQNNLQHSFRFKEVKFVEIEGNDER